MAPTPAAPNPMDHVDLKLDEIQGNILEGFNNDHQRFCFLRIDHTVEAKKWLAKLTINFTTEVKASNDQFRASKKNGGQPPKASWVNVAFSYAGLNMLGAPEASHFPEAFRQGMAARHKIIGDIGPNEPHLWEPWATHSSSMHVIVLLSADEPEDIETAVARLVGSIPGSGLTLIHIQAGEAPAGSDSPNEHFGFRDGISQPGVKGYTLSTNPTIDPNKGHQGKPGQDLLWPGEFVVGYQTQNPARPPAGFDGPNGNAVDYVPKEPHWAINGSYLVFRKLQQDVAGFRNSIHANADAMNVDAEVLGAKIVGRFRSGCPMEALKTPVSGVDTNNGDPSGANPFMLDPEHMVFFEYGDDPDGAFVPRSGHIRKAYPRDEEPLVPTVNPHGDPKDQLHESATQTHRIMRRGIPFGSYMATTHKGLNDTYVDDQISRGLLFLCYQSSIESQFEFIQSAWINNPNFPEAGDGADPVMSQVKTAPLKCPFHTRPDPNIFDLKHFVTTNAGEYFFQPSKSALKLLTA